MSIPRVTSSCGGWRRPCAGGSSRPPALTSTPTPATPHSTGSRNTTSTSPRGLRPDRRHLREFANFFGTYLTSSFDILEQPGTRLDSRCGCYCPMCARLVNAPHLRPKKLKRADKERAGRLKVDRVAALAREEGIAATHAAVAIVHGDETRRSAGYSAYGHWLIRRLDGDTDGTAVLALWREIAWKRTGSPIPNFRLRSEDFIKAEEVLVAALRAAVEAESSPGRSACGT